MKDVNGGTSDLSGRTPLAGHLLDSDSFAGHLLDRTFFPNLINSSALIFISRVKTMHGVGDRLIKGCLFRFLECLDLF